MADKPDTKKERRAVLGSHKYDAEEHKKRRHVKYETQTRTWQLERALVAPARSPCATS